MFRRTTRDPGPESALKCFGMVTIHSYAADGAVEVSEADTARGHVPAVPPDNDGLVWVDIENPSDSDWQWLGETFDFHPLAIEDARRQGQRAKVDVYDDHLFLSLRSPLPPGEPLRDIDDGAQELDLFVAQGLLVSVHPGTLPALAPVRAHRPSSRNPLHRKPGYLLYRLLDTVVDEFAPWMDALDAAIDGLETTAHENNATPDLRGAVRLKKQLLILRQMAAPVRDLVNQLLRIDNPSLIDPALTPFLQDVYDHTLRLVEQVDLHRDILGNVVDLMMAQTSNHLNAVMKTPTSVSTILMIDALIAGIYGMNFPHIPELHWPGGYFACLGLMGLLSGGLAWNFKRIGWL